MLVKLTPEIECALTGEARRRGMPPEQLALESLRDRFVSPPAADAPSGPGEANLADFMGTHLGVLHSGEHVPGGAALSKDAARKFVETLEAPRPPKRR